MTLVYLILIFSTVYVKALNSNIAEDLKCPDDTFYGYNNKTCLLFRKEPLNFNDAEKFCQSKGGHLSSLHDIFESFYFNDQALKILNVDDYFFIGGNKLPNSNWSWTDGTAFDFDDWAPGEPKKDNDAFDCLYISLNEGQWSSFGCKLNAPFACTILPGAPVSSPTFTNPLLSYGPDPWVLKHNGTYYYTHTMQDRIIIYKTGEMSELAKVSPVTIWTPPETGLYSKEIWGPEIHFIDGKFYVYFAADDGNNDNHRIYCLENSSPDPIMGSWTFKGKVYDKDSDHWAIDADTFEFQSNRYLVWSGWEGDVNHAQNIYIAKMANPWTLDGNRVMISTPEYDWETVGAPPAVNEGPIGLISPHGKLFITYSASGCWTDSYALGLLSLKDDGDPLNARHWTKITNPVFPDRESPDGDAFGTGHNGFFKSFDDSEDWIIYHANNVSNKGCDIFRTPRMQKFTWNAVGLPNFGDPAPINFPIDKPSGEH